jgi:P-type E1-E2 ATPase
MRPGAAGTVEELRSLGADVVLLTGDDPEVASRVAEAAGISRWEAGVTPAGKAKTVTELRSRGRTVLFAGDGLNDGPALAAADVGVAMGSGAASSILVADGVVGSETLAPLASGIRASRAAARAIRWNQIRSVVYNVAAVSLAAAGLINPLLAAILMPLSSGMVIAGAAGVERRVRREEEPAGQGAAGEGGEGSPAGSSRRVGTFPGEEAA